MVHKYSFDTGFLTLALTDNLPEKWVRPWNEVRKRGRKGYIIEPVIMETYYQLMMKKGMDKESARDLVMQMKSLESINIPALNDNDSFRAGLYHKRFNLSFVDCFVLALANRLKLKIYTTDGPLKLAAEKINVPYDYLPL
jgi:predicted nucleic acid-binding protein